MITMTCLIGVAVGGAKATPAVAAGALTPAAVIADRAGPESPSTRAGPVRCFLICFPPVRSERAGARIERQQPDEVRRPGDGWGVNGGRSAAQGLAGAGSMLAEGGEAGACAPALNRWQPRGSRRWPTSSPRSARVLEKTQIGRAH